jgi:hypothetical protein
MDSEQALAAIARIELLCSFWDSISKGETSTTRQIRAAISGETV